MTAGKAVGTILALSLLRSMRKDGPRQPEPYPARKARGGEIILKTPYQRAIFIAGLAGAVILACVLTWVMV
jgi:hypothetical protein